MASDFLGLIFTEAGRDLPTSGPSKRPVGLCGHFLPGTQSRRLAWAGPPLQSHAAPGKSLLSALKIMSFLFTYDVYCL